MTHPEFAFLEVDVDADRRSLMLSYVSGANENPGSEYASLSLDLEATPKVKLNSVWLIRWDAHTTLLRELG